MSPVPFPTLIEDAVRSAELSDLSRVEVDLIRHRSDLLLRWCAIHADLASTMDPGFDPGRLPDSRRATSPDEAAAQAARALEYTTQTRLVLIERRANESLGRFLRRYYTASGPDHAEFEATLQAAGLPDDRLRLFRHLYSGTSTAPPVTG